MATNLFFAYFYFFLLFKVANWNRQGATTVPLIEAGAAFVDGGLGGGGGLANDRPTCNNPKQPAKTIAKQTITAFFILSGFLAILVPTFSSLLSFTTTSEANFDKYAAF